MTYLELERDIGERSRERWEGLYPKSESRLEAETRRYQKLLTDFRRHFAPAPTDDLAVFSTSGRTEICGNHTDHNRGKVVAAAVDLDTVAVARRRQDERITVMSEGFADAWTVDLARVRSAPSYVDPSQEGSTAALISGVAARFVQTGRQVGGFDAYLSSRVLRGSGLSSSASVEVLLATVLNGLYNEHRVGQEELAMIAQYAENVFFGKPCGLMDQMACAVGGIVAIDFADPVSAAVVPIRVDFGVCGYQLAVIDTGGSHDDLTPEYAAVPAEMKAAAGELGQEDCRGVESADWLRNLPRLRRTVGDRAALRVYHYLRENERVDQLTAALKKGDFPAFINGVRGSGLSSMLWLQNGYAVRRPEEQGIGIALALAEMQFANGIDGAARPHGGGFAGTIQVVVERDRFAEFCGPFQEVFGDSAVQPLAVRDRGTAQIF